MTLLIGILLAVILFFAAALVAVRSEELRRAERRKEDLPVPVDRRKGERRNGGSGAHFRWKVRSLRMRIKR